MNREILAKNLVELRKKSGLNQRQAAEKLGISPAPLSAYELGKKLPPLETLAAMAEMYGVSCDYLLGKNEGLANLGKNIAELLLSGKIQHIETTDESLKKAIKNITAICNSTLLTRQEKIDVLDPYIQSLRV